MGGKTRRRLATAGADSGEVCRAVSRGCGGRLDSQGGSERQGENKLTSTRAGMTGAWGRVWRAGRQTGTDGTARLPRAEGRPRPVSGPVPLNSPLTLSLFHPLTLSLTPFLPPS